MALAPGRVSRFIPASSHAAWRPCPPLVCCLPLTPLAALSFSCLPPPCCLGAPCIALLPRWLLPSGAVPVLALFAPSLPSSRCAVLRSAVGGGVVVAVWPCWVVAGWLVSCGFVVVLFLVSGRFWLGLVAWGGCCLLWCGGLGFVLAVWVVGWLWVLWWAWLVVGCVFLCLVVLVVCFAMVAGALGVKT